MTWESGDLSAIFPDSALFYQSLRHALSEGIMAEKKRSFGVEVLIYEDEDKQQADELAEILIK